MSDFYAQNIALIKKCFPESALRIDNAGDPAEMPEQVFARDGSLTLRVSNASGEKILLHSAYDPVREADEMLGTYDLENKTVAVVFGLGLGFHVRQLLLKYPWVNTVIVIEPNLPLLKQCLRCKDFSDVLGSSRVLFLASDSPDDLLPLTLTYQIRIFAGNPVFIQHPALCRVMPCAYDTMKAQTVKALGAIVANINTVLNFSDLLHRNFLGLVAETVHAAGVRNLFGLFKGRPAICVNSGPSLNKNIEVLRQAQGKAVIIAIDSVANVLLNKGIRPDIICTVDYTENNYHKLDGVYERSEDLFLSFSPQCCPAMVKQFKGWKFVDGTEDDLYAWFAVSFGEKGVTKKGLCVSHQAFSLASAMGADPIVLIGQDLSYPLEGLAHFPGTAFTAEKHVLKNETTGKDYFLFKDQYNDAVTRELIMIEDINGDQVATDQAMLSYRTFYENYISGSKATVIQASEQGAKIKGSVIMPLQNVIETYCREPFNASSMIASAVSCVEPCDITALTQRMETFIGIMDKVNALAEEGAAVIGELLETDKRKKLNAQLDAKLRAKSDKIKDAILRLLPGKLNDIVSNHGASNSYLVLRSLNLRSDSLSGEARTYRLLERVALYYEGLKNATSDMKQAMAVSLEELTHSINEIPAGSKNGAADKEM